MLHAVKCTVVDAGAQTTVQDATGRCGYWDVGVPPSGAFDEFTFALVNAAVGNPDTAAGLECVVRGPVLTFDEDTLVCVGGGLTEATVDGRPIANGQPVRVRAGSTLDVGPVDGPGMRGYVAVQGGIDVPRVLGSRATFILGGFGGVEGRPVVAGDVLPLGRRENLAAPGSVAELLPVLGHAWELRVIPGPHGAPEHLTPDGVDALFEADWRVDHRADRTGVRLVGPTPTWARTDGGEAGLHPSNVHDSAYPVGGIMLSGDTPVIVGKDGPSLGGFVVPAAVIGADLWKLGQLRPGDAVRLVPVTPVHAGAAMAERRDLLDAARGLSDRRPHAAPVMLEADDAEPAGSRRPPALADRPASDHHPAYTIRRSGDRHLLVEAGPASLELTVRVWVHLLAEALRADAVAGVVEVVEGVRSVLVKVDDAVLALPALASRLVALAAGLPDPATVVLDVREVTLPMAFDHPEAHEAMRRYQTVNPTAPWNPDNVEFIRRVNDLPQRDDVFDVVTEATYLVVGLGDVYLGAPVAVPIDPRHRLVTTKYNPARTWTPQNAVGIGGIYLCIYGMEGPGGYQLVGRTVPVWRLIAEDPDRDPKPWLLRQFDRIRFVPVSADELAVQRAEITAGLRDLDVRPATFSIAEVAALEAGAADEIALVRAHRRAAFEAERERWVS
ncbi:5-oxoprolinase/urea amidolyase family protein [Nocardioides jiangxiensis]|uniref:5-oxoprolinase/urea amidolyase family protein n=1 Tax=Nocardioides jiangxiensis TaxID=3064524 RepID=A0ABT9B2V3_9ACTN|nr:5-oxoprolinase/urea amidolyase family protein [Nocardioides sp. WY-20]MDO7868649.1 5-oxoprolinase/urea amidolyase family protein [Nocardioides sp. WY-20]